MVEYVQNCFIYSKIQAIIFLNQNKIFWNELFENNYLHFILIQITDLTVDWEKVKTSNSQKDDTPELVEKANQVADTCSKGMNYYYNCNNKFCFCF